MRLGKKSCTKEASKIVEFNSSVFLGTIESCIGTSNITNSSGDNDTPAEKASVKKIWPFGLSDRFDIVNA